MMVEDDKVIVYKYIQPFGYDDDNVRSVGEGFLREMRG
jgi:hypothetical protein